MRAGSGPGTTVYLAGPLFSEAERDWHRETKRRLLEEAARTHREVAVIWPYELITQEEIAALGERARAEIFRRCREGLDRADVLVALLDGVQVDDGTAWEVGYFRGTKPRACPVFGIRTDFRNAGESAGAVVNAMIELSCDCIVRDRDELVTAVLASVGVSGTGMRA